MKPAKKDVSIDRGLDKALQKIAWECLARLTGLQGGEPAPLHITLPPPVTCLSKPVIFREIIIGIRQARIG